jgi:cytoskeletal protein RodZ
MTLRSFVKLFSILALFLGGAASAQAPGTTSGSASGKNVEPSTAIQKQNTGRSSAPQHELQGSSNAAGAPAVEGKPGAQSGQTNQGQTTPQPSK